MKKKNPDQKSWSVSLAHKREKYDLLQWFPGTGRGLGDIFMSLQKSQSQQVLPGIYYPRSRDSLSAPTMTVCARMKKEKSGGEEKSAAAVGTADLDQLIRIRQKRGLVRLHKDQNWPCKILKIKMIMVVIRADLLLLLLMVIMMRMMIMRFSSRTCSV